jgi:hypothetical protein
MKRSVLVTAFALVVGAFAVTASADETIVMKAALDKVPPPVMEAAKKALPGFEAQSVTREKTGNQMNYKLEGAVAGKTAEILVSAEAKVLESEVAIELKDVPKPVMDLAVKAVAGLVVEKAMKGTEGTVAFFDLTGKANNKEYSVKITADGKVLEIEEAVELKDVPKAVTDAAVKAVPGFVAESAKKITLTTGVVFELTGKVEGKACEIKVGADGKVLGIQREGEPKVIPPGGHKGGGGQGGGHQGGGH